MATQLTLSRPNEPPCSAAGARPFARPIGLENAAPQAQHRRALVGARAMSEARRLAGPRRKTGRELQAKAQPPSPRPGVSRRPKSTCRRTSYVRHTEQRERNTMPSVIVTPKSQQQKHRQPLRNCATTGNTHKATRKERKARDWGHRKIKKKVTRKRR